MNLKKLLAKKASDLTDAEKAFLADNVDSMSAEQKALFDAIMAEDGMTLEEVKALVTQSASEVMEKKAGEIADILLGNLKSGIEKARARGASANNEEKGAKENTRLFLKALFHGDKAAAQKLSAKALTTDVSGVDPDDAQAGLLIPTELMAEVLRIAQIYGVARANMFYLPFSGPGNSRTIPSLGTSVNVFWTGEGAKKGSTQPKFNIVNQTLKKLTAIVPMTEEILEDSAIDLTSLIGTLLGEAVAKEEDIQFFTGTGSPWTGVLNNSDVNHVDQASGDVYQLTADDLLDMQDETPAGALPGSKYYLNRKTLSIVRKLKSLTGEYIFQAPAGGLPGTIWDFPYVLSEAFPAPADVQDGDAYILFGNLQKSCVLGDKQQVRVKLLDQATVTDTDGSTSINLAEQDMIALRMVERVGYVCALPKALTVLKAQTHES